MVSTSLSPICIQELYARMLLTRVVDDYAWKLYEQGRIAFVASSRGHEALQVGSAMCIEVGTDFTLPYYRDLGVVLTIGMTPYEVFRTYLQTQHTSMPQTPLHWGYQKHNTVTGSTPVATQILHAAGIAFACKLRKAHAVTVAYFGDGATTEPDFLEGINFAAQHQLPVVFVCEHNCPPVDADQEEDLSCTQRLTLPTGLMHWHIEGSDVVAVFTAMQDAMRYAREGHGPVLLEIMVSRPSNGIREMPDLHDPLLRCQQFLQEQGICDAEWLAQLSLRIHTEVEQATQDAIRDMCEQ